MKQWTFITLSLLLLASACKKSDSSGNTGGGTFSYRSTLVNGINNGTNSYSNTSTNPTIKISFSEPINRSATASNVFFKEGSNAVDFSLAYENNDSIVVVKPNASLKAFTSYSVIVAFTIKSVAGNQLANSLTVSLQTGIDSTNKFPTITDDSLLTLVQKQTFKYFWDFGHPNSGMARERNTSGDVIATGGSGFGIMAIVTGISRNFITRSEGLTRLQKIVAFLKTAKTWHGAFPHWINGNTGATVPFSTKDDGADLVETSYLMQGLLTARQYFSNADAAETTLRTDITNLYNAVEWSWFRKSNENVLYWHWSSTYNWDMNLKIQGWNEGLMTYVLGASSTTYGVPKAAYTEGWARNGAMVNGSSFYGITLPLGNAYGGPLFFTHYSFMGINPTGLTDTYANYWQQNVAHAKINYNYCKTNPNNYYGYSEQCWGLTASDIPSGYTASSPTNDVGVIAPTAALASFPYTPAESMAALKFFYYKLGDRIWKDYGFTDAFSLKDQWFASSYLAIDQGPIIVMIENYRTGLLWNLFMSNPEVKTGMKSLGFQSPNL
ncbi:MAG: glucoamylase family protein [Chitinophagaceae bacterium]